MTPGMGVLSLGGGVQASALLLMARTRLVDPLDAAVFAGTGREMPGTYEHLDYLRAHAERASTRSLTVSAADLHDELLRHGINGRRGEAFLDPSGEPLAHMAATQPTERRTGDPAGGTGLDCEAGGCFT